VIPEGCGHWTQQERPREVNESLVRFLSSVREEDGLG
jgi:pimeloyl-ACP methyl ester carboxylesterase